MSADSLKPPSSPASVDAGWFARDVQPHEPSLRAWLRGKFPFLPDVDDIVQESYLRLIRARQAGKVGYAKAYLFTTARNFALDLFRRREVVAIESVADVAALPVLEESPGIADALGRQQELELLAAAVQALPDRCRQAMTLRLLYGLSHKEIAAELRISEHTVKAQLAKGMRRCADYFAARGIATARIAPEENKP